MKLTKYILRSSVILSFFTIYSSCESDLTEKPNTAFSVSTKEGPAPLQVSFVSNSNEGEIVRWEFGDGNQSAEISPIHTYYDTGEFVVVRESRIGDDLIFTFTKIKVNQPEADFTMTPSDGRVPCLVEFKQNANWATDFEFDFGNGEISKSGSTSFLFTKGGSYEVKLKAKGSLGNKNFESEKTKILNIKEEPIALKLNKGTLLKFPKTKKSGSDWDVNGSPDVFLRLIDAQTGEKLTESSIAYDLDQNILPEIFTSFNYMVEDLSKKFAIEVVDSDNNSEEWIGGFYLIGNEKKSKNGEPYANTLIFTSDDGLLQLSVDVEWLP